MQIVADPGPSPTGAVVCVGATGLCRSDWHAWAVSIRSATTGFSRGGGSGWGPFPEYVALEYADTNLVHLPEDMRFVIAAILGCRFPSAYDA